MFSNKSVLALANVSFIFTCWQVPFVNRSFRTLCLFCFAFLNQVNKKNVAGCDKFIIV